VSTGRLFDDPVDDPEDSAGPQRDELLDIGEEAGRLAETLAGWWSSVTAASSAGPATTGPAADPHDDGPHRRDDGGNHAHHEAPTGESCRVCPLCRALDIARGARPDLLTKVATAAETVALLLREAAAGDRPAGPADAAPGPARTGTDETPPSGTRPPGTRPPGTPIVVRDMGEASTPSHDQQRRDTPWG
jgi:hypothetical protein